MKKEIKAVEKVAVPAPKKKFKINEILILLKINGIEYIHLCKKFKDEIHSERTWKSLIKEEGITIND